MTTSKSHPKRRAAVLGGNRIPFARSDGAYAHASNQDMFTAALEGLVARFGLQAAIAAADGIAMGRYEVAAAGGVDTTSDAPIAFGDDLRRTLLGLRRAKSNVDRLKLVGKLPASLGVQIPTNGEPRTGLSMGDHAAITAKKMSIKRVDQDALAAASHRNMAAAYDAGFFDDLVSPAIIAPLMLIGCAQLAARGAGARDRCRLLRRPRVRIQRCAARRQSAARILAREIGHPQAGVRRAQRRRHDDGG